MKIKKIEYNISDVVSIDLKYVSEENGSLVFLENEDINFSIERIFTIKTNKPEIRGNHAHKECFQLLYCPLGEVEILCDDANYKKNFCLDNMNKGLIIPPTIWATQKYSSNDTILNVICSHKFLENDYIRDYENFKKFRENINN
jgi:dTDP-4-dehydrorhamnose 3,5-epimerase-like enzyme